MQYRRLGSSGLKVSAVSLGSWLTVGNALGQDTSDHLVGRAVDGGVNLLDTADVYNMGEGEIALGRAIEGVAREHLVIATKCFFAMSDDVNDRGLSRKHVFESLHASLLRLRLDYIDLYQCHRPDPETPIAETAMAMDDLIRQGKVLYWGVSEWPAELIEDVVKFCRDNRCHAPISNQPLYNLFERGIEAEVMPTSAGFGVSQIVFSPLAQGVLTGKYSAKAPAPPGSRAADQRANRFIPRYLTPERIAQAERFAELAGDLEATPGQLALAWCLRRTEVSSVIVGATTVEQIEENLGAVDVELSDDTVRALDELFPA